MEDNENEYAFSPSENTKTGKEFANIGGIAVELIVASGASATVSTRNQIKSVTPKTIKKIIFPWNEKTFSTELQIEESCVKVEFTVIEGRGEALLGKHSAVEMGILKTKIHGTPILNVAIADDLTTSYSKVFERIGKLVSSLFWTATQETIKEKP